MFAGDAPLVRLILKFCILPDKAAALADEYCGLLGVTLPLGA